MRREVRRLLTPQPCGTGIDRLIAQSAGQCDLGQTLQPFTISGPCALHLRHRLQDATGARRDDLRRCPRRAQQRRGERRLARVQTVRPLAEQAAAHRCNADHLATKAGEVEISLENLVLLPALFQPQRARRLRDFLRHVAPRSLRLTGIIRRRGILVEQTDKLHGQRTRPARARVPQVAPRAHRHGAPVDARVFVELAILRNEQRAQQGR